MSRRLAPIVLALAAVLAAGAARAAARTHAATARAGVVVIDTTLGYEGGEAAGTGMVLTSTGEVLTNNHVIRGATSISVVVPQTGRRYSAVVLGYDVAGDTALLRLKGASGLATVRAGSSVQPGQPVTGVGNAGGTGTLSTAPGTVTGLGRSITVSDDHGGTQRLRGLIQTSTSLRPGDSGGPLLDASGRVVGMDTAASSANSVSYSTVGVSYAIPIATALAVVRQIEAGAGTAAVHVGATPWLGVSIAYGRRAAGAFVAGVVPGSPADLAGLGYGDRIVAVGGHAITSPTTIVSTLLPLKPGARLAVTWVDPSGARHTSMLTLAAGPPQ